MSQARPTTTRRPPTISTPTPAAHDTHIVDSMDELLDAIDECLEENAVEVTRSYVQQSGQ